MTNLTDSLWTPARVTRLRFLAAKGLSSKQIAVEMNCGFTRNAIIGKLHRLNVQAHPKNPDNFTPEQIVQLRELHAAGRTPSDIARALDMSRQAVGRRAKRLGLEFKRDYSTRAKFVKGPGPTKPRALPVEIPPPEARMISLLELQADDCRWPIGDPQQAGFSFCGAAKHRGSYCAYHARLGLAEKWREPMTFTAEPPAEQLEAA